MKSITVRDLNSLGQKSSTVIIDVREPSEFKGGHITGSHNVPLAKLETKQKQLQSYDTVYTICLTGPRSQQAQKDLTLMGVNSVCIEGGFEAWKKQGKKVTSAGRPVMPITRQVFIAAGALVLVGTILAKAFHENWVFLAMFAGAGLTFSGLSGFCGMQKVLEKLPWNNSSYIDTLQMYSK